MVQCKCCHWALYRGQRDLDALCRDFPIKASFPGKRNNGFFFFFFFFQELSVCLGAYRKAILHLHYYGTEPWELLSLLFSPMYISNHNVTARKTLKGLKSLLQQNHTDWQAQFFFPDVTLIAELTNKCRYFHTKGQFWQMAPWKTLNICLVILHLYYKLSYSKKHNLTAVSVNLPLEKSYLPSLPNFYLY